MKNEVSCDIYFSFFPLYYIFKQVALSLLCLFVRVKLYFLSISLLVNITLHSTYTFFFLYILTMSI
ncbi:hypothetical protein BJV82DRAFT_606274 [Fennellomyces sp. T-0311]|nr:hypothetical protein BJV82DRAFT_606274 [Fennellomyces sp. T-0311]